MAYKFLTEKIENLLNGPTGISGMGSFVFSRGLSIEGLKGAIDEEISPQVEDILAHDFETFTKLVNFVNSNASLFVLHGFMGSGKSTMVDFLPKITNDDVLCFRINCFESTNLDDVLLSIHTDFVNYHNQRKITLPKVDSTGFTDRINAYLKSINMPMLFIFDSVNAQKFPLHVEISNFIKHISQIERVKIVVASRNLADSDLSGENNQNYAIIKLCGKEEFIEILNKNDITSDEETYNNAFEATKGHFLYISLLINVIKLLNLNLKSVYNDYSKKKKTIFDFLISKVLTLIPERFFKTLWFLALIRSGVSENFLIKQKLSTPDELAYLEERMLLCREGINIYLKDYVKSTVIETINPQTFKDIHTYLAELYESQLPKKPSERDLIISRSTMRREAAYHKEQAAQTIETNTQPQTKQKSLDYNYLSYSNSIKRDWNFSESSVGSNQQQQKRFVKPAPRGLATRINNNLRAKNFELSNEELKLLNQLNLKVPNAELIRDDRETPQYDFNPRNQLRKNQFQNQQKPPQNNFQQEEPAQPTETLVTVMNEASLAEQEFDFERALKIYNKAYSMTEAAGYDEAKPIIMMQTAFCHRKMQNNDEALKCFEIAYKLYCNTNPQNANKALFNMAEIYTETYNHNKAKEMYEAILHSNQKTDLAFNARVLLNLAEIESNNLNIERASVYYNEALSYALNLNDKKLICETCFKFGLAYDDAGSVEKAFKMYSQCIQTSNDYEVNSYISSAYSNIAGIFEEQNLTDKAAKYYELSVKIDEQHENWDGLYFAYSKLATIYQAKSLTFALDYSFKALDAAKKLNDNVYTASTYIQIGDYYYQSNQTKDALKSYLLAKALLLKQPNPENVRKIDVRINDMKTKLGTATFERIASEFQSQND